MRFRVRHTTRYRYSRPVFLEPHTVRLRPRCDASQRLKSFQLQIEPEPAILSEALESEGNDVTYAWFEGTTERLLVHSEFEVETLRENPFDYILMSDRANSLPLVYPEEWRHQLDPYISCPEGADSPIGRFARSIADSAGRETLPFLAVLNGRISKSYEVVVREEGDPLPAEKTLNSKRAACRDLAVLFMECCRSLGIASRFVSGYHQGDPVADRRHMHAWAEVYLPGGGWRGYDPAYGLAVADRHFPVAASAAPQMAGPVTGSARGTGATSKMDAEITLETIDSKVARAEQWVPPSNA